MEIEQAIEQLPAGQREELASWLGRKQLADSSPRHHATIQNSVVLQSGWNPGGRKLSEAEVQSLFDELRG